MYILEVNGKYYLFILLIGFLMIDGILTGAFILFASNDNRIFTTVGKII